MAAVPHRMIPETSRLSPEASWYWFTNRWIADEASQRGRHPHLSEAQNTSTLLTPQQLGMTLIIWSRIDIFIT